LTIFPGWRISSSIKKCGKVYLCFQVLEKSGTIDHLVKVIGLNNLGYGTRTIHDRFGLSSQKIDPWASNWGDNSHITSYNKKFAEVKRRGLSAAQCYASVKDFFDNPNYKYYSKRYSDPFKKPHKYAKTSIKVASGNKTFSYLQDAFKLLPIYEKKKLQRILKDQKYYSSTIDGIFGRQTWKAIVAYSDKNRMPKT
jgi:hypothetical protein